MWLGPPIVSATQLDQSRLAGLPSRSQQRERPHSPLHLEVEVRGGGEDELLGALVGQAAGGAPGEVREDVPAPEARPVRQRALHDHLDGQGLRLLGAASNTLPHEREGERMGMGEPWSRNPQGVPASPRLMRTVTVSSVMLSRLNQATCRMS